MRGSGSVSLRRVSMALVALAGLATAGTASAAGSVVISQVYGGGGNSGAVYTHDFVELFNRSSEPVSLAGLTIQYASATGTGNLGASATQLTELPDVMLQPGQYYLVQQAQGSGGTTPLPAPDLVDGTPIAMSASAGKVALVAGTASLGCNGASTPCDAAQLARIVDLVGYGSANFFEGGAAAPALTNTTAALRAGNGCTDTDVNGADFSAVAPAPRNSASPLNPCESTDAPVIASCPATFPVVLGVGGSTAVSANDADDPVTGVVITSTAVPGISLQNVVPGNPLIAELLVDATTAAGNYTVDLLFSNGDATPQTAPCSIAVNVAPAAPVLRIRQIQGSAHLSPRNGQSVADVPGTVTALRNNGFYMQDPSPDSDPATSEGIFVFTNTAPGVTVGDAVLVSGTVLEFRPGGAGTGNLTLTEITGPSVRVVSSGNPLPAPVVLGIAGRAIPDMIIDDDATGEVETSGSFDASTDGIDFYESLEGMRVQINNPVASGPTNDFGELSVLADGGADAGLRTPRGGIVIRPEDFNPERIILDDGLGVPVPAADTGDGLSNAVAVVDYSFGNFKFYLTAPLTLTDNGPAPESTLLAGDGRRVTVATYNVENLDPGDGARFGPIAAQIVDRLRSPDILALVEVQDNSGPTDNGVTDASQTYAALIAAITAAGGPTYEFRDIAPENNLDGGQPGGNIRVGFLFNPARVTFVDRPGGSATVATTVVAAPSGPQLSVSPGRIDPTNAAFAASRKPLVGEFLFNGRRLFAIANHFNSKGGDDPLFGRYQPPVRSSEVQRNAQAALVSSFVQSIRALDANANVVVLGDLNDFQFSDALTVLKTGSGLVNLVDALTEAERYTYVFDGNSQVLDHILVSPALATKAAPAVDIVHINAEFTGAASDHDPLVASLELPRDGDVDGDGDVDLNDINLINAARNQPASGPADPRDLNRDGRINGLDARIAVTKCTRPRCAVQ
jgi:hypothetical protein